MTRRNSTQYRYHHLLVGSVVLVVFTGVALLISSQVQRVRQAASRSVDT